MIEFSESGGLKHARYYYRLRDYIPSYNNLNPAKIELPLKQHLQAIKIFDCANKVNDTAIGYYCTNGE